jgi:(2Fe-2S) ferredoxin
VDEIIEAHIIGDQPVARLVIPDAILNTTHKK